VIDARQPAVATLIVATLTTFTAVAEPVAAQMNPELIRAQCEVVHEVVDQSILYGVVMDGRSGTPLPGSTVHLSWVTGRGSQDSTVNRAATETQDGAYIFCDVPQNTRLVAWAVAVGLASPTAEFYFDGGESTHADLEVALRSVTGRVSGIVLDAVTGGPVEAATIVVPFADISALTDSQGRFRIDDIPVGVHDAQIHHIAYGDPSLQFTVSSTVSAHVTVRLDPQAIALEPISVQVQHRAVWLERTGFFDRVERQLGQFVTPEEVDMRPWRRFAEVLREVPGVNIRQVCVPHCSVVISMAGATQTGCTPTFYVDGRQVRLRPDDRGTIDLDSVIFGLDLAAVEVYRGIAQTPAQFYGRCGSVVIWTKRGAG